MSASLATNNSYVGLITDMDDEYYYIWHFDHRTKEFRLPKNPDIKFDFGEVVQFELTSNLSGEQEIIGCSKQSKIKLDVELTPEQRIIKYKIKVKLAFAPVDYKKYQQLVNSVEKLHAMAFNKDFGQIALIKKLDFEPGAVYEAAISRIPRNYSSLADEIGTLFAVAGNLTKVEDAAEIEEALIEAPWLSSSDDKKEGVNETVNKVDDKAHKDDVLGIIIAFEEGGETAVISTPFGLARQPANGLKLGTWLQMSMECELDDLKDHENEKGTEEQTNFVVLKSTKITPPISTRIVPIETAGTNKIVERLLLCGRVSIGLRQFENNFLGPVEDVHHFIPTKTNFYSSHNYLVEIGLSRRATDNRQVFWKVLKNHGPAPTNGPDKVALEKSFFPFKWGRDCADDVDLATDKVYTRQPLTADLDTGSPPLGPRPAICSSTDSASSTPMSLSFSTSPAESININDSKPKETEGSDGVNKAGESAEANEYSVAVLPNNESSPVVKPEENLPRFTPSPTLEQLPSSNDINASDRVSDSDDGQDGDSEINDHFDPDAHFLERIASFRPVDGAADLHGQIGIVVRKTDKYALIYSGGSYTGLAVAVPGCFNNGKSLSVEEFAKIELGQMIGTIFAPIADECDAGQYKFMCLSPVAVYTHPFKTRLICCGSVVQIQLDCDFSEQNIVRCKDLPDKFHLDTSFGDVLVDESTVKLYRQVSPDQKIALWASLNIGQSASHWHINNL